MMKHMMYLIPVLLLIISCKQESTVNICTKTANQVKIGTPIFYKGIQVGNVKNYSFLNSSVLLNIEIDKDLLPLKSYYQFHLENINSFDVGIILTKEHSINNKLDSKTSTIYCNLEFPKVDIETLDSIATEGNKRVVDFFSKKIDSIIDKR